MKHFSLKGEMKNSTFSLRDLYKDVQITPDYWVENRDYYIKIAIIGVGVIGGVIIYHHYGDEIHRFLLMNGANFYHFVSDFTYNTYIYIKDGIYYLMFGRPDQGPSGPKPDLYPGLGRNDNIVLPGSRRGVDFYLRNYVYNPKPVIGEGVQSPPPSPPIEFDPPINPPTTDMHGEVYTPETGSPSSSDSGSTITPRS